MLWFASVHSASGILPTPMTFPRLCSLISQRPSLISICHCSINVFLIHHAISCRSDSIPPSDCYAVPVKVLDINPAGHGDPDLTFPYYNLISATRPRVILPRMSLLVIRQPCRSAAPGCQLRKFASSAARGTPRITRNCACA